MERIAEAPPNLRRPIRGPKRLLALRSDSRLVDLVRSGDAAAFEVLYERHVAGVLGFCRHMLGSQEEAEDAVQQAFVSAHDAIGRTDRELAFKAWLYTIARNRCLSILRARRERPAELPELSTPGLNEEVERRADLRELLVDLERLPEHQRTALVLSELGDLSHAEIAEVIGHRPHAIKGLVFRARSALAERRDARSADCEEIRLELANAKGGALRRGRLRYHLENCPACVSYLEEVRRQRKLLGIALPVAPPLALKNAVMSGAGIGAGTAGTIGATAGGGIGAATAGAGAIGGATTGGTLLGGAAVKLAIAGTLVAGGAGVTTEAIRDDAPKPAPTAPSTMREEPGSRAPGRADTGAPPRSGTERALERRNGARGTERRARGQRIADRRSRGRSAAGEPRGKALGRERAPAATKGKAIGGMPSKTPGDQRKAAPDTPQKARGIGGEKRATSPPAKSRRSGPEQLESAGRALPPADGPAAPKRDRTPDGS